VLGEMGRFIGEYRPAAAHAKMIARRHLIAEVDDAARVSTNGQDLTLQEEALKASGCDKLYREKRSGARSDNRPRLARRPRS